TSTFSTGRSLMRMPRIFPATSFASAGDFASLTPPALPRPPACTCAFTTTVEPNCCAARSTSSGVVATTPGGTGTPCAVRISRAWYSWMFIAFRNVHGFAVAKPAETNAAGAPCGHPATSIGDDGRSRPAFDGIEPALQPCDDRAAPSVPHEVDGSFDLRSHAAGTELARLQQRRRLLRRQALDELLRGRAVAAVRAVYVREDEQHLGAQLTRQDARGTILVDYCIDAFEPQPLIPVHRRPAAATRNHDRARVEQPLDLVGL